MSWITNFLNKSEKNSFDDKQTKLEILENKAQVAIDRGDPEPAFLLGNTFNDIDDPFYIKNAPYDVCKHNTVKAKYWLEKAVDGGHPDAMVVLGSAYCEGGGMVKKDFKYGLELIKKAKTIGTNPPQMADIVLNALLDTQMNKVFNY